MKKEIKNVRALILVNGNKTPFIKRIKNQTNIYWVVPGGSIEKGESPEDALHREIKEELGMFIKNIKFFHYDEEFKQAFYLCEEDTSKSRVKIEEPEIQRSNPNNIYEIHELTSEEIKNINLRPKGIKEKYITKINS